MSNSDDKIVKSLKRLNAKKESLFRRAQTLNDMISGLNDEKSRHQFIIGARTLERSAFESILDDIHDLELDLDSNYSPNYEPLSAFDTLYGNILTAIEKIQASQNTESKIKPSTSASADQCSPCGLFRNQTNLPPLEIKPFTGDVRDWPRFRDIFSSVIINNARLTNVEKLHYLITTVTGRAADIIKDYSLSDANFLPCWECLQDRYQSHRVLATHFFEELIKPVSIPAKPSVEFLQSFVSKIQHNVNGLKNMKLDDLSDFLFFSLSIRQLDQVTRKEYETKMQDTKAIPSFVSLLSFVKSSCRLLEITAVVGSGTSLSTRKLDPPKNIPSYSSSPKNFTAKKNVCTTVETQLGSPNKPMYEKPANRCPKCGDPHQLYHCPKFLNQSVSDRHAYVKKNSLCFNCLGNHAVANCKSTRNCFCNERHHRLLHFTQNSPATTTSSRSTLSSLPSVPAPQTSKMSSAPATLATVSGNHQTSVVLLGTASALIKNKKGKFIRFRLLIDCASAASFITDSLANLLDLPIEPTVQQFSGLSNTPVGSSSGLIECTVKPIGTTHPQITARALIVDTILSNVPQASLPDSCKHLVQGLHLADPDFHRSLPVDMLLGCDVLPKILVPHASPPFTSELGILCTVFGHVIIGPLPLDSMVNPLHKIPSLVTYPLCSTPHTYDELHKSVERFWETETISTSPPTDPVEEYCENHFVQTHVRDTSGRYIVEMPFIKDPTSVQFHQSKEVALQRFHSLEHRFRKNTKLRKDCVQFLNEYLDLGHMVKATRPGRYFIPYFCVFNPNSPTTPTRVVFDGSAKKSHISLNEILYAGPKLQHEVPEILLNFRIERLVFCCDIAKMYRQINVQDDQCIFQHILFRDDPSKPLEEYELRTITYGLSPSAFCSQRCLIQLTKDEGDKYPLAVPVILNNSVVDDLFAGAKSIDKLLEIKSQLSSLLATGGFQLNKWLSNSPAFLNSLKESDSSSSLVIRNADDTSVKVLGVGWDPKLDVFFFALDPPSLHDTYTKRQVLSSVARIYDPLGLAAPVIFLFKCLLKEIWLSGVGWDDPIPPTLSTQWNQCLVELPLLCKVQVPRCLFSLSPISCNLLGFSDGSMKGSAAALFLRVQYSDESVKVFLLKSKTKVAPSKGHTIPRLELIGALLLTKLIQSVQPFLTHLPVSGYTTHLFCDSTIVLSWIRKPPHLLKLFVSNRVSAILENTTPSEWYYVPTVNNIADCASRGLTPQGLLDNIAWFQGPKWTYDQPEYWPITAFEPVETHDLPEVKPSVLLTAPLDVPIPLPAWLLNYSNLPKLQKIAAYILRFLHNIRNPNSRRCNHLTVSELNLGLNLCIKLDQHFYFNDDVRRLSLNLPCSMKVQKLSPFIDKDGLIRVGGRLKNSSLPYTSKHQILLHNKSYLTRLIIVYFHESYLHSGFRTLQALLFNRYWIVNSKQTIKKIIYECIRCSKLRLNTTANPPMGDLPAARVTPSRPFSYSAVDLAGPYILKESLRRNAKTYKAYFALFVCFAVKAVHIEVLTSLSSDCFIAALTRFSSRRGLPSHIYCDQGTNFKGAARQLSEIVEFLRSDNTNELIASYLTSQGIDFQFNCPRAPFMAGLAESHVKNIKFHLKRSIGSQTLTLEEFSTITARIESILNSRPLCSFTNSPDDFSSLTPGHFLIGSPLVSIPEVQLEDISIPRLSRWQLVSQISQSLWRRWEKEYLHTLQNKEKWFLPYPNVTPGQLVWLHEDNTPPLSYPMGRIIEAHPGKDGIVRTVTIRTSTGTYRRPARKIAPLPIN